MQEQTIKNSILADIREAARYSSNEDTAATAKALEAVLRGFHAALNISACAADARTRATYIDADRSLRLGSLLHSVNHSLGYIDASNREASEEGGADPEDVSWVALSRVVSALDHLFGLSES